MCLCIHPRFINENNTSFFAPKFSNLLQEFAGNVILSASIALIPHIP
jgi:hypothetical protein